MIASAIYNIVDRIFVGRYVGPVGLASITVSFPTMLLVFAFAIMIGVGGASRVSILRGARKRREAEQALAHVFMLLFLLGAGGIILALTALDPLLQISGVSGETLPGARKYLRIIMLGTPVAMLSGTFNSLIRACGSPRYAMITQIVGASANVVLDALFIINMGMGVEGAAYGTVLAQGLATFLGIIYYFTPYSALKIRPAFFLRPVLRVFQRICAVGSAPFLVNMTFVLFMTVMNRTIVHYGGDIGLSAIGIFFSVDSLLFLPSIAVGDAILPIIGYNYGAGKYDRVIKTIKTAIFIVTCLYLVSFLTAEIFAENIIRLFNDSPELLAIGVPGMRIGYCGIVFVGVTITTNSVLQGLGKARATLILSTLRSFVFMFMPLLFLPRIFGMWGIWMALPTGDVLGCITSIWFLHKIIGWLRARETESQGGEGAATSWLMS
jgi:putative MATE family efflux protein